MNTWSHSQKASLILLKKIASQTIVDTKKYVLGLGLKPTTIYSLPRKTRQLLRKKSHRKFVSHI